MDQIPATAGKCCSFFILLKCLIARLDPNFLTPERFENGTISEIQLRNIYRQFYDLDEQSLAKLEAWKNAISGSYAAHLIRGVHFKRKAGDARGGKYISQTSTDKIQRMQ
ncbi:MAG: hypothetical protein ABI955_04810 [Nitrospirota bacterium]